MALGLFSSLIFKLLRRDVREAPTCYRVVFYTATSSDRRKKEAVVTVHSCSSNTPCLPASSIVVCSYHYSPVPSLSTDIGYVNNK